MHNVHDDVTKWKRFPRYWRIVWGIHRSPVKSPHKGQIHGALIFALIRLSKKSRRRWFETPSHSLWRQRNAFHVKALTCVSENPSVQWAHWPPSWANHNAPHKHHLEEDINTTTQVNRHWASSMGSKTYRSQGVYCTPWQRLVKMQLCNMGSFWVALKLHMVYSISQELYVGFAFSGVCSVFVPLKLTHIIHLNFAGTWAIPSLCQCQLSYPEGCRIIDQYQTKKQSEVSNLYATADRCQVLLWNTANYIAIASHAYICT